MIYECGSRNKLIQGKITPETEEGNRTGRAVPGNRQGGVESKTGEKEERKKRVGGQ